MTRELKLALIVGFSLVLVVTVLISDHLSSARSTQLAGGFPEEPIGAATAPVVLTEPDIAVALSQPPIGPLTTEATPTQGVMPPSVTEIVMGRTTPVANEAPAQPQSATLADASLAQEILRRGGTIIDGKFTLPVAVQPVMHAVTRPPAVGLAETLPVIGTPTIVPAVPERLHTVVPGDNLFKIAKRYYGDGNLWSKLAEYNTGRIGAKGEVRVGTKLRIPTADAISGRPAGNVVQLASRVTPPSLPVGRVTAEQRAKPANYTVRKGDTLGAIARRELGSSKRAGEIIRLNKSVLRDPDNVPLGAVLKLPTA